MEVEGQGTKSWVQEHACFLMDGFIRLVCSMKLSVRAGAALRAAFFHFCISILVAVAAGSLVFGLWYPFPYRELAGGRELFLLIVTVDVVCGPLLTMVLFNPQKPRRELTADLGLVILVQLMALAYGLYSLALARPVYLAYEVDRFRVVSVADIQEGELKPELGGFHRLPWLGPKIVGVRDPVDAEEKLKSLDLSFQGNEPSARPDWWVAYEEVKATVLSRARPMQQLRERQPDDEHKIDEAVRDSGQPEASLQWVPLTGFKSTSWVALVDARTAEVRAFAPVDGF